MMPRTKITSWEGLSSSSGEAQPGDEGMVEPPLAHAEAEVVEEE
jgi:hypothetical protein